MSSKGTQGKVWKSKQYKVAGEIVDENSEESVDVAPINDGEAYAKVKFGYGLTINLGNYESARIDVGVELPCLPAATDNAFDKAREMVEKIITAEVREVRRGG